jgi:hypothetical protein
MVIRNSDALIFLRSHAGPSRQPWTVDEVSLHKPGTSECIARFRGGEVILLSEDNLRKHS